jgi:hypothetical protein
MATETRPQVAKRRKSGLMAGFDSLTLDPSPRLRRVRQQMTRQNQATIGNAWKAQGKL